MAMEIRRARAAEHTAIGALTEAAYEPFLLGPDDTYRTKLRDAAVRDRDAELWIAVEDHEMLGNVTVCPDGSPWRELARPGEGEFRMLAVSPTAQGRGVGRALTSHVLGRFRALGARTVVLSSLPEMTSAHRMYAGLGFVRVPTRDWAPHPGVDLLAFEAAL